MSDSSYNQSVGTYICKDRIVEHTLKGICLYLLRTKYFVSQMPYVLYKHVLQDTDYWYHNCNVVHCNTPEKEVMGWHNGIGLSFCLFIYRHNCVCASLSMSTLLKSNFKSFWLLSKLHRVMFQQLLPELLPFLLFLHLVTFLPQDCGWDINLF